MKWLVEIKEAAPDIEVIKLILEGLGITIIDGDYGSDEALFYIYSDEFTDCSDYKLIWKYANRLKDVITTGYRVSTSESVTIGLGNVLELAAENKYRKHIFGSVSVDLPAIIACVEGTVSYADSDLSEEEINAKIQEADRLERRKKANKALHFIGPAVNDEAAYQVIDLLCDQITPLKMGHIFDLIQNDIGGKMTDISSKKDITRFTTSINHPDVFGKESRHMVSNQSPPPKPMSKNEANSFIRNLAEQWLRLKFEGSIV